MILRLSASSLFSILVLSQLLACTSSPKQNQDPTKNNPNAYRKDWSECKEDYPETPDGVFIKQRIACMNLKGWK